MADVSTITQVKLTQPQPSMLSEITLTEGEGGNGNGGVVVFGVSSEGLTGFGLAQFQAIQEQKKRRKEEYE